MNYCFRRVSRLSHADDSCYEGRTDWDSTFTFMRSKRFPRQNANRFRFNRSLFRVAQFAIGSLARFTRFARSEGPYGNFAGRDASRGLGKGSFESSMLRDPNLEGLDDLADLDEEEVKALDEWHQHFNFKYYHAGWLVGSEAEKGKVPRDFGETKDGAGAGNKTD